MAARQLAERRTDGIVVELYWDDSDGGAVFVEYRDERNEVYYTLYPSLDRALEAYYHPNAYVRGESAEFVLRAAA